MSAIATVDSAYAFTAFSYAIILTRTLLRRLKHERLLPDDYLMLFAMVFYAFNTACYPITIFYGTSLTTKQPDALSPEQVQRVIVGLKWLLEGRVMYMLYMWTLKACILIYFFRLTARTKHPLSIKLAAGLLAVTLVTNFLICFLECRPIWLHWQVLPKVPQCAKATGQVVIFATTNILTDFIIMVIPLPLIFSTKLPLKRRIQISSVFLIWIFVIAISVIKVVIVLRHPNLHKRMIWTQVECFSATIAANAPIIHGLWRHSYLHIRQGRFGKEVCRTPPEYHLDVRAATDEAEDVQPQDVPRSSRASLAPRVAGDIRNSIRKINEKIRSSFDDRNIEQSISILQETRTGQIDRNSSEAGPGDMFMGRKGLGHVSTEISCGNAPTNKSRYSLARLKALHNDHESH